MPALAGIVDNDSWLVIESRDTGEIEELRLPAAVRIILGGDKNAVGRLQVKLALDRA